MLEIVSLRWGCGNMETVGKVLSLTLLTIFGSAAATVYLVESDLFPSIAEKTPIIYTSISGNSEQDFSEQKTYSSNDVDKRKHRSREYYEVSGVQSQTTTQKAESIWGQSYSTNQHTRAEYLASVNSMASLRKELKHWNSQYQNALDKGQKRIANLAYSNIKDYRRAIEIKTDSETH